MNNFILRISIIPTDLPFELKYFKSQWDKIFSWFFKINTKKTLLISGFILSSLRSSDRHSYACCSLISFSKTLAHHMQDNIVISYLETRSNKETLFIHFCASVLFMFSFVFCVSRDRLQKVIIPLFFLFRLSNFLTV